jgi:hypothetical protein
MENDREPLLDVGPEKELRPEEDMGIKRGGRTGDMRPTIEESRS